MRVSTKYLWPLKFAINSNAKSIAGTTLKSTIYKDENKF